MNNIILKSILWLVTFLWKADFAVIIVAFDGDQYEAEQRCRESFRHYVPGCLRHAAMTFENQNQEAAR